MNKFVWTLLLFFVCNDRVVAQMYEHPFFDRSDIVALHIEKVKITKEATTIYCSYSAEAGSWANISKDTYLQDKKTKKKYPLIKCDGLPFEPGKKTYQNAEKCEISFSFPSVKLEETFDFIEKLGERAFNIYGINIRKHYERPFSESELKRLSNMASFYDSLGDTLKSIQYKKEEIEATKYIYGIKSEAYLNALLGLCLIYNSHGNYTKAVEQMELLNKLQAEIMGTADWLYALQLRSLAQFYSNAKMYDKAINTFKESIALYEKLNIIDEQYILALNLISYVYKSFGNENQAIFCQNKAIQARKVLADSESYLEELKAMIIGGDTIARIQIVENELEQLPQFVDTTSFAYINVLKALIKSFAIKNEYDKAIRYCDKSLSILKNNETDNILRIAEVLAFKCKFQQRRGSSYEAIFSGEKAKSIFDSLNVKTTKYAKLLSDLAWAYGLNYDFEKSIQLQRNAAIIHEEGKDWISLAEVYNNISYYYQSAENLDTAEQYIKKAIDVLNEHDNAEQYIMDAVEQTGNNMMNNPYALASIKLRIDTDRSNFLQTLARIYQKQGNYADAVNTEIDNGKIIKGIGDTQMYAVHLMALSEYHLRNNQPQEAIECSEESIQLLSNDDRIGLALSKLQLAIICFQASDTTKAIRYAEESLSASSSISDIGSKISAQSLLSFFYWKDSQTSKAESCLSDELDYLEKFISNELSGMTTEQKQRLWDKYEHNFLLYRNIVEKSDRNADLLSKLYDYILFSKSLLLDFEIQQRTDNISQLNIKWKDIQQHLSNDAIAIEFISTMEDKGGYNTYHALVIDKESPSPMMITLYSESKLDEIKKTDTRDIRDIVGELIWKPILDQYATVKDIYFSPDGILHMLPIEYYSVDGTNGMFENYNMYRLSSTKELIREINKRQPNSAVLYGGIDYNQLKENSLATNSSGMSSMWRGIADRGGFDPLFNTALETQEIKELLTNRNISTTLYSGEEGTEESFRNLSGQNHGIIHLATHGMYINPDGVDMKKNENNFDFLESLTSLNDPVKEDIALTHSFLVMAGGNRIISRIPVPDKNNDGILTSKEISQLDLRGLDLVVLSACESALGDINNGGVFGLQRGFKKAGAKTILMSLDKVNDEATRILMVEFYRNLMNGKSKFLSLKDAQKHLRQVDNGKYDKPEYWASFIMLDGLN